MQPNGWRPPPTPQQGNSTIRDQTAIQTASDVADVPTPVTLVVPVYNEEQRIEPYLPPLLDYAAGLPSGSELIFADDGSHDRTVDLIEKSIAERSTCLTRVLRLPHLGKGAALRAALLTCSAPLSGFCDVDLSTSLVSLDHIRGAAERAPVLAIGSRDVLGSKISRAQSTTRELLGRVYNRAVQFAVTPGVVDTQCGAKFAQTALWRILLEHSREDGFAWDVEVVAFARELGIPVQEVPVEWEHKDGTKVHLARDGASMLRALARIARRTRLARAERRTIVQRTLAPMRAASRADHGVFDDKNANALAASDITHWWFRNKAAFVSTALRMANPSPGWLYDLGGGSGGVTASLGWSAQSRLLAEGSARLASLARARYALDVVRADVGALPFADASASVACLLDVIEHLEDPIPALREARRSVGADGLVLVTVPAHPRLWSAADEALGHVRRYSRSALKRDLELAGLTVQFSSHIFSWLVVPVWIQRRSRSGNGAELGLDQSSILIDRTALLLTAIERLLITRCRVRIPVGTSIIAVARPTAGPATS